MRVNAAATAATTATATTTTAAALRVKPRARAVRRQQLEASKPKRPLVAAALVVSAVVVPRHFPQVLRQVGSLIRGFYDGHILIG
jgi:outer membrane receptor protein involved in Fe transport